MNHSKEPITRWIRSTPYFETRVKDTEPFLPSHARGPHSTIICYKVILVVGGSWWGVLPTNVEFVWGEMYAVGPNLYVLQTNVEFVLGALYAQNYGP